MGGGLVKVWRPIPQPPEAVKGMEAKSSAAGVWEKPPAAGGKGV